MSNVRLLLTELDCCLRELGTFNKKQGGWLAKVLVKVVLCGRRSSEERIMHENNSINLQTLCF